MWLIWTNFDKEDIISLFNKGFNHHQPYKTISKSNTIQSQGKLLIFSSSIKVYHERQLFKGFFGLTDNNRQPPNECLQNASQQEPTEVTNQGKSNVSYFTPLRWLNYLWLFQVFGAWVRAALDFLAKLQSFLLTLIPHENSTTSKEKPLWTFTDFQKL